MCFTHFVLEEMDVTSTHIPLVRTTRGPHLAAKNAGLSSSMGR